MLEIQRLLAKNIKEIRKQLGLSQAKLAEMVDCSTSFIGEIEIGRKFPSAENLQKIADSLGLDIFQLFLTDKKKKDFDKQMVLGNVKKELQKKFTKDLEETINKYLK